MVRRVISGLEWEGSKSRLTEGLGGGGGQEARPLIGRQMVIWLESLTHVPKEASVLPF